MFLIIAGRNAPGDELIRDRAAHARTVIAADKEAEDCLRAGVIPDMVLGRWKEYVSVKEV